MEHKNDSQHNNYHCQKKKQVISYNYKEGKVSNMKYNTHIQKKTKDFHNMEPLKLNQKDNVLLLLVPNSN